MVTKDLMEVDWPSIAKSAHLTTIGTHITPREVERFLKTERGHDFVRKCKKLGINVEHELHALHDLLPRSYFNKNPRMFRMNEKGERVPDWNLCVHSKEALEVVCRNAVRYSRILRPTTGRYFYWIDDGKPMCRCPKCRGFSDSDQALILENALADALSKEDPRAKVAHLAYSRTISPPTRVAPNSRVFLEFAPIERSWKEPLKKREVVGRGNLTHGKILDYLDANLEVFRPRTAQVLEYWLDVSLHSRWKRPAKRLPWKPQVFREDIETYAERGIRHVVSFAVWIDGYYVKRFGPPDFVKEYGRILFNFRGKSQE